MSASQVTPAKLTASEKACAALLKDLLPIYKRSFAAGAALASCTKTLMNADDLVLAYGAAARVILALEAMRDVAEIAAKDARSILLASMADTGCPQVSDEGMTVYPAREPAVLVIENEAALPSDLMTTPAPAPDRKAIKAAIEQGRPVPGASILQRNSQRLVIRNRKD